MDLLTLFLDELEESLSRAALRLEAVLESRQHNTERLDDLREANALGDIRLREEHQKPVDVLFELLFLLAIVAQYFVVLERLEVERQGLTGSLLAVLSEGRQQVEAVELLKLVEYNIPQSERCLAIIVQHFDAKNPRLDMLFKV